LYQARMIDDDECEAVGGMRIGRENRSTLRKPAPVPLCPTQIRHDLTWARNRAAALGSRRLTVRAMARPTIILKSILLISSQLVLSKVICSRKFQRKLCTHILYSQFACYMSYEPHLLNISALAIISAEYKLRNSSEYFIFLSFFF
jgi:hypothetical protein